MSRLTQEGYQERAERYDDEASKLEDWAGILHDHPVSEAFKEQHPDVSFTPNGLIKEEKWLEWKVADLQHFKQEQSMLESDDLASDALPTSLDRWAGEGGPGGNATDEDSAKKKIRDSLRNPNTTVSELRTLLLEAIEDRIQTIILPNIDVSNGVLEDVRTGRASEQAQQLTNA